MNKEHRKSISIKDAGVAVSRAFDVVAAEVDLTKEEAHYLKAEIAMAIRATMKRRVDRKVEEGLFTVTR